MKCCENCFNDVDIKARIRDIDERGDCDFCHSKNVYSLDIKKAINNENYAENIIFDFEGLLNLYIVYDLNKSPALEKLDDESHKLADQLFNNTNIFNLPSNEISKLLKELLHRKYIENKELFNSLVIPRYLLNDNLMKNNGIFKGKTWESFERDIKYNNRFHSTMTNENILMEFFEATTVSLPVGSEFYRARISNNGDPIPGYAMGAAPLGIAGPGRLNASGIGYLYLCERYDVAIAEIKSSLNDLCTVAKFKISSELNLVDLSQINKLSIFQFDNKEQYLMNYEILNKLDYSMRRLSSNQRSEIEYVPTEFISDLIKYMQIDGKKVDGIKYISTIDDETRDIVLFDENKAIQLKDELLTYQVKKISYTNLKKVH
ncbi:RES family NAD+ phosphorylase [Companilactobacillus huachuanensis]|uniref:RES family NAD+ phosphorylase n=1 Tax=Companilactobacillus huachuanensis TaxID=2559914 RepID=A0ABW1RMT9_9LACO|nr:RES family NAD+ phosphorylase [Companilactobacillus huachuanensis]